MSDRQKYFVQHNAMGLENIYTDQHIHSTWTDGESDILQIVHKSKELGLKRIAITDHVRKSSTYFQEYCKEIREIAAQQKIEILVGFEAKVNNFDGDVDVSDMVCQNAQIRIASVHRFPMGKKLCQPSDFKKEICQMIELELSIAAIKNKKINVLGHPGGMSLKNYNEFPLEFFEQIISECQKYDVAFELNYIAHLKVFQELRMLLKKCNPLISLGSDMHKIENLGGWIQILTKRNLSEIEI